MRGETLDKLAGTWCAQHTGQATRVRSEVAAPLTEQAECDGTVCLATIQAEAAANARLATVGRFGRRKARDEHRAATEQAQTARAAVRQVWEAQPPRTLGALSEWAAQVAERRAENDPRVSAADHAVEAAR